MVIIDRLRTQLDRARRELLDLTARNRLLNVPRRRQRGRYLEIVDELCDESFRILVQDRKRMGFLPADEAVDDGGSLDDEFLSDLAPPVEEELDERGIAIRHRDSWLQTHHQPETLQKRLLRFYYDSQSSFEELGINILYLALGMLEWYESPSSDRSRYAPLLLIPVVLERGSALKQFRLSWSGDDIISNLSLIEKLSTDFGLRIPDVPEIEDLVPATYFQDVRSVVASQKRFLVHDNDTVLGFFSFAKLRMYHDLDPAIWPENDGLLDHPLIEALLSEGFRTEPSDIGDDDPIDRWIDLNTVFHVLDADSSQAIAVEEVRQGRSIVIQGPPGTGKSQTICNLIAAAAAEDKRILFVAEKMAALDVVKRRMEAIGLGKMCLELHGRKANKRDLLAELERTLSISDFDAGAREELLVSLQRERDLLNAHAERLHEPLQPSCLTPYTIMGHLVRLREQDIEPVDFALENAEAWTIESFRERRGLIRDLAARVETMGLPSAHVWRGVGVDALLPTDIARLTHRIRDFAEEVARLQDLLSDLQAAMGREVLASTLEDAASYAAVGRHLAAAPDELDPSVMQDPVWVEQREVIAELVTVFQALAAAHQKLDDTVVDAAWSADVVAARQALAAYGASMFRFFNRDYRRGMASLRGLLNADMPKPVVYRIDILDTLMAGQSATTAIEAVETTGAAAFGKLWRGVGSNGSALQAIDRWDREAIDQSIPAWFRAAAKNMRDRQRLAQLAKASDQARESVTRIWRALCVDLKLDLEQAFEAAKPEDVPLDILVKRLTAWQEHDTDIIQWVQYRLRAENAISEGLTPVVARLYDGRLRSDIAVDTFEMAYYEPLMRKVLTERPELNAFDGEEQNGVVKAFTADDLSWIQHNRAYVASNHVSGLPRGSDNVGQLGVLRHEFQKRRRHLPIRQLMSRGGLAIQAIKPVFMMSPLSIAQFLEPGKIAFDLLLIDEASQVQPVDALGAIARCKQIVVVGDDKQLPPTAFFSKLIGDDDSKQDDEDDLVATGDIESILGLCAAQGMPDRMLRWHYRSRDASLISVSNHEFYDDRLYVVPNPHQDHPALGLKFNYLANGIYDRGGSRTNRVEAAAVADAVIAHSTQNLELSLGVGCFSAQQRDAILDELEQRWRDLPEALQEFFSPDGAEPFFVKNLENIQGDERDVIFISVGYARNHTGYMAMNFGPVSRDGGERRLNVLITRARQRCEVFSSITADDIDLERGRSRGVAALKTFLQFAATRLLSTTDPPLGAFDSPFEEEVAQALQKLGHEVHAQVGVAGFFIDLAIVAPDRPGRYLLGIECDGAAYHSARSARDRDRLRQQVLEDHGWIIHRIWSTDWFRSQDAELRKCEAAVEMARATWTARDDQLQKPAEMLEGEPPGDLEKPDEPDKLPEVDDHGADPEDDEAGRSPPDAGDVSSSGLDLPEETRCEPYREAAFEVPRKKEPHDLHREAMADIVVRIVEIEGPIHKDEVARRVASLWGYGRTGRRVVVAARGGLRLACKRGAFVVESQFYRLVDTVPSVIRDRASVASSTLRRPDMLGPAEIRAALLHIARSNFSVGVDEIITHAGRLFGFRAISARLRSVLEREVGRLLDAGVLVRIGTDIQMRR